MAEASGEVRVRRIVVVLDAAARAEAALRAAAELAARREAELVALFLEDLDLVHLAGLPFAREIGFPSAASRALDVEAVERVLRRHAEQARRMVAEFAAGTPLKWSFQVARGALAEEILRAAAEAELVIAALGGSGRAAAQLAEACGEASAAKLLQARTLREMRALLEELRRR